MIGDRLMHAATLDVGDHCQLHYQTDDFTDPWRPSDWALLLHGICGSADVWRAWVPHLGRQAKLLRPDMRGFGRSTPMAQDYRWSPQRLAEDYLRLLDHLGIEHTHIVATKAGGLAAMVLAAGHPDRVLSLTIMCTPFRKSRLPTYASSSIRQIFNEGGVKPWIQANMKKRMGSDVTPEELDWWARSMLECTPRSTLQSFFDSEEAMDFGLPLEQLACPTYIITTTGNTIAPLEEVMAAAERIPDCRTEAIEGDAYDIVARYPDVAAPLVASFLRENSRAA